MRRISETGTRRREAAFTLVEVLVVVAITGIIIAVASVNLFPSDAEIARRESGNVALAIEGARDAAWFGGRPTSVTIDEGALRAWRYAGGEWRPDSTRDRALESTVRVVSVYVDGEPLKPGDRLVFMPDGLGIPFRVALEVRGLPWAVEGDVAGAIRLVQG
jgi:type II secretion system protein H